MFVAFEGIDGSGKSLQARLLYERLVSTGRKAILTYEPSNGSIGNLLETAIKKDRNIDNTTLQLFFTADRAYHILYTIKPALENGIDVITDRYMFSTIAYGAASGVNRTWLREINSKFVLPDFTFVLDAKPETAIRRITSRALQFASAEFRHGTADREKRGNDLFETKRFLGKVRREYLALRRSYKGYYVIDSEDDPEAIETRIGKILNI
jgi:dTMP kinase